MRATNDILTAYREQVQGAAFRVLRLPPDAARYFYGCRIRRYAEMRWAMAKWLQAAKGLSHAEIGQVLHRDHSTITYSLAQFNRLDAEGTTLREMYEALTREIANDKR